MPKTAVNENYFSFPSKDDVGRAWNTRGVEPIPVAKAMKQFSYDDLGLGVSGPDPGHALTSFFLVQCVSHGLKIPQTSGRLTNVAQRPYGGEAEQAPYGDRLN